jgi:hypothetical protein
MICLRAGAILGDLRFINDGERDNQYVRTHDPYAMPQ